MSSGQMHPTQRRYPPELRDREVRMVWAAIEENDGNRNGVIPRVARLVLEVREPRHLRLIHPGPQRLHTDAELE